MCICFEIAQVFTGVSNARQFEIDDDKIALVVDEHVGGREIMVDQRYRDRRWPVCIKPARHVVEYRKCFHMLVGGVFPHSDLVG